MRNDRGFTLAELVIAIGIMVLLIGAAVSAIALMVVLGNAAGCGDGIHAVGDSVALIEGECVTINWDASEEEWQAAHAKWCELRDAQAALTAAREED